MEITKNHKKLFKNAMVESLSGNVTRKKKKMRFFFLNFIVFFSSSPNIS